MVGPFAGIMTPNPLTVRSDKPQLIVRLRQLFDAHDFNMFPSLTSAVSSEVS